MRITDLGIYHRYLRYDKIQQNKIERYSKELSSGKKILQPSDATIDNAQVLRLKSITKEIDGFLKNMDFVETTQSIAENTLKNISSAAEEAKIDFIQLLNTGVLDSEDATIFKQYFENVRDYIIKEANTKIGDSYIFGGIKSQQEPFDNHGNYQGSIEETKVPIASGTEVPIKFNGDAYLATTKSGIWNDSNTNGTVDNNEYNHKIGLVKALDDIIAIIDDTNIYKLHGKNSELGYASIDDTLIGSDESGGTISVQYGDKTFSIDYDSDPATSTPTTLKELVDAFNALPNNKDTDGTPLVKAYTFMDRDGVVRLGFYGKESTEKLDINITGDLQKHTGNFEYIMDTFDRGYNDVERHRSMIGTQEQLLANLKEQHETFKVQYKELISKMEDADFSETIVKLQNAQTAYDAIIATYMQNKDLSLLNYFKK